MLDIFAQVWEPPPEEQTAVLAQACPDDEAVRREVISLLQARGAAPDFLAAPALQDGLGLLKSAVAEGELQPGEMLAECWVLSLLGEGGMGEIYLAEDTRLERRVAVKLLKQRVDDASLARRFRHERKILAALTHPNIARLYGGGTTAAGRSYLIMEYVEGERLDHFCQRRGLGITERLTLFRKVCAAVAYAHQNLVVHRDLKPANIRVTAEGEPKMLDFGIAKLLDPDGASGGQIDATLTLSAAMTPEYASPEQIKGEPNNTVSDVYSLGVVLYELLTGQRPYAHLRGRRPDELARAICEEEPPRLSTVANLTFTVAPASAGSVGEPALDHKAHLRLRQQLKGDLDNIVGKALHRNPARRYPNVIQLADDLRRYAEGQPVSARRDTFAYRTGKFVRRNKATVAAAAALAVLALVVGLVVATLEARRANRRFADVRRWAMGEQRAVARWRVGDRQAFACQIDLQRELGHVQADVKGGGNGGVDLHHGMGSALFCELARGRMPRGRSGNCSSHHTRELEAVLAVDGLRINSASSRALELTPGSPQAGLAGLACGSSGDHGRWCP